MNAFNYYSAQPGYKAPEKPAEEPKAHAEADAKAAPADPHAATGPFEFRSFPKEDSNAFANNSFGNNNFRDNGFRGFGSDRSFGAFSQRFGGHAPAPQPSEPKSFGKLEELSNEAVKGESQGGFGAFKGFSSSYDGFQSNGDPWGVNAFSEYEKPTKVPAAAHVPDHAPVEDYAPIADHAPVEDHAPAADHAPAMEPQEQEPMMEEVPAEPVQMEVQETVVEPAVTE